MAMEHEKIYTRPDGGKVLIRVRLASKLRIGVDDIWSVDVMKKKKRATRWNNVFNSDDYIYRRLEYDERLVYIRRAQLAVVTPAEILGVKMELWEKIRPTDDNTDRIKTTVCR